MGAALSHIHTHTVKHTESSWQTTEACRPGLHAWQNNSDYVNELRSSSLTKKADASVNLGVLRNKKQKSLEFLSKSTGLEASSRNTSMQYLLNNGPLKRERTIFQSIHFNYYSVNSTLTLASATRAVMQRLCDLTSLKSHAINCSLHRIITPDSYSLVTRTVQNRYLNFYRNFFLRSWLTSFF